MRLTTARVRGLEEASFLLYVRGLDFYAPQMPINEPLFDFAAWFFDFNKLVAYGMLSIVTFFLAQSLLHRPRIDGIELADSEQLNKLRSLCPFPSLVWLLPAGIASWQLAGAALKPVGKGSSSLQMAWMHAEYSLIVYRLVYLVLLLGSLWFLFVSLELLIRVRRHNRKHVNQPSIALYGNRKYFISILVIWFGAILTPLAFTGPGTQELIGRALWQGAIGALIVIFVSFLLPDQELDNKHPRPRRPWVATIFIVLPFIAGVASAFVGGGLITKGRIWMPAISEETLLRQLKNYTKEVGAQTVPDSGITRKADMLHRVHEDLKAAHNRKKDVPLVESLLTPKLP